MGTGEDYFLAAEVVCTYWKHRADALRESFDATNAQWIACLERVMSGTWNEDVAWPVCTYGFTDLEIDGCMFKVMLRSVKENPPLNRRQLEKWWSRMLLSSVEQPAVGVAESG